MYRSAGTWLCCMVAISTPAFGVPYLPAARTVGLAIHEVSDDPFSPVRTRIRLEIQPIDRVDNAVGWRIDRIEFYRNNGDSTEAAWAADLPAVPSADGLWWVDHADPLQPQHGEFGLVPWLLGTAVALDGTSANLEYDLAGSPYTPPPDGAPYETTTSLSYTFAAADANEPVSESSDDEPVEVPPADPTDPQ